MGGQNNWPQNITMNDWMRDMEKRILHEERRPQIRTASDLLGPGFGPYAIRVLDWNDDVTGFDGFFWADTGSRNSPDPAKAWMGQTVANSDGSGYQLVTDYGSTAVPPPRFIRTFTSPAGGARVFTAWMNTVTPPPSLSGVVREVASTSTTVASALTGTLTSFLTVTIPNPVNNRVYRASFQGFALNDTATAFTTVDLRSGVPVTTASVSFMDGLVDHRAASRRQSITLIGRFTYSGADGVPNLGVMLSFVAGSNNSQMYADANRPSLLTVDEIIP